MFLVPSEWLIHFQTAKTTENDENKKLMRAKLNAIKTENERF